MNKTVAERAHFIDPGEDARAVWLSNFAVKLVTHGATVGVSVSEISAVGEDAAYFRWCLEAKRAFRERLRLWTAYMNIVADGPPGTPLDPPPLTITLPAMPAVTTADIIGRASALGSRIKKHAGCTDAIAQDLGLIGVETVTDLLTVKPQIKLVLDAGHPVVKWKKKGMSSLEIWVDRGTGVFVFLAIDTEPDYPDTAPLPGPGLSAVWKYRAIYRKGDAQVGQWSDVVSQTVVGV